MNNELMMSCEVNTFTLRTDGAEIAGENGVTIECLDTLSMSLMFGGSAFFCHDGERYAIIDVVSSQARAQEYLDLSSNLQVIDETMSHDVFIIAEKAPKRRKVALRLVK